MQKQSRLLAAACHSVLAFASVSAVAQDSERRGLEEIVVTAQKRSETVQDVPVAVSAYTDEMRDLVGITSIGDLTDFTPGLTYSLTQDRISLRGVGRLTNNYGSDPGVATYADGFYTASTVEAGKRPILVDRIEILRGPQGTLYGRNSIGGAINVITKRPSDQLEGELRATVGNYDTRIYEGAISGPITEWLRYRFAGFTGGQGEGFFEDTDSNRTEGGKNDDLYVEGQLEFNVGEGLDGWFKYSHAEWDQARRTLALVTPYDVAPTYFGGLFPNATFNGTATQPVSSLFTQQNAGVNDPRKYNSDTPFRAQLDKNHIFTLELVGHLSFADLKYVGGYQGYTYTQVSDYDRISRGPFTTRPPGYAAPITIYPTIEAFYKEDKEYYSNEINLISTGDAPLQWILGLYQYHEQVYQDSGIRAPLQAELSSPSATPFGPPGPANPDRNLQLAGAHLDADSHAVFGQLDYNFTDTWKATIGLRYTEDMKDADEFRTRVLYGFPNVPGAFYSENNRTAKLQGKWHATTGTAGVEWSPTDDMLAFVKYTRGYKSGGFNASALAGAGSYTDPESVNAYEVGWKQTFFDRLTTNFAVFYYDYADAQIPLTVRDPLTNLNESRFFNFEETSSRGAELEANWAVTDAFNVLLSYSYLDTEISDTRCFIEPADTAATAPDARPCGALVAGQRGQFVDGDELPSSPNHKVALNANYTWDFSPGSLTLSSSWTYRDDAYYAVFSREHYRAPSYDETDFRILWNDANSRYTVIGFLRNAFDDEGYERADATQSAWGVRSLELALTNPRTYGVEVQYRF